MSFLFKSFPEFSDYLEHTFRTHFENLLTDFIQNELKNNFKIIHEPKRLEKFGAPDFKIIDKSNTSIGYIECKDINIDISTLLDSEQIQKYLSVTNNLLLTNYIDFILFKDGKPLINTTLISKIELKNKKPKIRDIESIKSIFEKFFLSTPEVIKSSKTLSIELAKRTKILKDFIIEELETKDSKSQFTKVYDIFQKTMIRDLNYELFSDIYSQIICFGLLFFKLSKNIQLTRYNILEYIPHYIPLLKDVYNNARFDKWEVNILWILDEVLLLLNNIDTAFIVSPQN